MYVHIHTHLTAKRNEPPTDKLCGTIRGNNCPDDVWREEECLHQTNETCRELVFSLASISFNLRIIHFCHLQLGLYDAEALLLPGQEKK